MKYDGIDAEIDYDFLVLKKVEIKCKNELMEMLQEKFKMQFKFGEPINLKSSVIRLTKFQIIMNWLRRKK